MSADKQPLFASFAKIKSAEIKYRELVPVVRDMVQNSDAFWRTEVNGKGFALFAGYRNDRLHEISLKVGETVGQLRDALDKMTVALVVLNGRGTSSVGFPWGGLDGNTGQPFPYPTDRHKHLQKKLADEHWRFLIDQKPYPSGNDLLWGVNQIANCDKHSSELVDCDLDANIRRLNVGPGGKFYFLPISRSMAERTDAEIAANERAVGWFYNETGVPIEIDISADVVFGDIAPVSNESVLPILNQQIRTVKGILKRARDEFF